MTGKLEIHVENPLSIFSESVWCSECWTECRYLERCALVGAGSLLGTQHPPQ